MRATLAATGCDRPSTRSVAVRPMSSATTSSGAIAASSSSWVRSTISSNFASTDTRSPTCTSRCDTSPAMGETSVESPRALRASAAAASAACRLACAAASLDTEVSRPVGEMKPCATSARLFSSARLAMSACARLDDAVCSAWRSRQSSSVVSSWPSTWPRLTLSPSRTVSDFTSAATLALMEALLTAFKPPDTSSVRVSSIRRALTMSLADRSSATTAFCAVNGACSALRACSARATNPPSTATATTGINHFIQRFMNGVSLLSS